MDSFLFGEIFYLEPLHEPDQGKSNIDWTLTLANLLQLPIESYGSRLVFSKPKQTPRPTPEKLSCWCRVLTFVWSFLMLDPMCVHTRPANGL